MRGASRASLAEAQERLEAALSSGDAATIGDELFAVLRLLDREHVLRRALSDPARPSEQRGEFAAAVLEGKVDPAVAEFVADVVRLRWARSIDLTDALERLAVIATVASAEASGDLDDLEDELFRFGRIVAGNRELARILSDTAAPAEGKSALLDRLLSGRVSPVTEQLLRNVLTGPHAGNAESAVERLSEAASRRRGQTIAWVTSAVTLTAAQEERLTDVLGRLYGRTVGLQVTVDPSVLGGLIVRVGDEVIDGSIAHRLEVAGRRLAG
jgi:F-type H+-transporting ATPase subunit delta